MITRRHTATQGGRSPTSTADCRQNCLISSWRRPACPLIFPWSQGGMENSQMEGPWSQPEGRAWQPRIQQEITVGTTRRGCGACGFQATLKTQWNPWISCAATVNRR